MTEPPAENNEPQPLLEHSEDDNSEHYSKEPQIASDLNERNIEDIEPKKEEVPEEQDNDHIDEEEQDIPIEENQSISNNAQIASEHNDRMQDFVEEEQKSEKRDCIELKPVEEVHEEIPENTKDLQPNIGPPPNSLQTPNDVPEKSRNEDLKIVASHESAPGEITIKSGVGSFEKAGFNAVNSQKRQFGSRLTSYSIASKSPNKYNKTRSALGFTPKNRLNLSKMSQVSLRSPLNQSKSPLRNAISLKQGMTQDEFNAMRELFLFLDYDRSGVVDPQELLKLFESLKINERNPYVYEIIKEFLLSADGEKGIAFEQFITAFTTNITDDLRKDRIKHLYNMLCDGNAEKGIDVEDMKKLVKNVGESLCVSEIQEIISRLSKNGKSISLEEFTAILCSNDSIAEQPEE